MLRLKEILKEKHISGSELARRLGVTNSYVNQALHETVNLSLKQCEKIASLIGVPMIALFDGYEKPKEELVCPHCGKPIEIHLVKP